MFFAARLRDGESGLAAARCEGPDHGILSPMQKIPGRVLSAAHRLVFAAERFGEHELANHAAAGAYAFLLSATPAVLLVLGIASTLLSASPAAIAGAERLMAGSLGALDVSDVVGSFFGRPLSGFAAIIGAVSLIWSVRLLVVTIQRSFHVIWGEEATKRSLLGSLASLALELAAIVAIVAMLAGAEAASVLIQGLEKSFGPVIGRALDKLARAAPSFVLFAIVGLSYWLVPKRRPRRRIAAGAAALCTILYAAFSSLFRIFIATERYDLVYGVIGSLILLLVNVYTFFSLYLYFAELAYVEEHLDALLFGRFGRLSLGAATSKFESALFMEPDRLFRNFGKAFSRGESVFEAGDTGGEAYFVHRGKIGIFLSTVEGERQVAEVARGEVFGEMAYILSEPRNATARALEDTVLLELPPSVFETYIRSSAEASRGLIATLSERLKGTNARFASSGGSKSEDNPRDSG
jgi:membrane protein